MTLKNGRMVTIAKGGDRGTSPSGACGDSNGIRRRDHIYSTVLLREREAKCVFDLQLSDD
jgi:hypothetical protein